ncbi:MAG: nuclear transport factor 2 family protein [Phycisphaerae bacterium]|nr:nuclear transport factor 2 family protein [Phycisphaerae bacterium]
MGAIKSILFEHPAYVYIALTTATLVLAFLWWERRAERNGRKFLYALAVPFVLGLALLVASTFVVTDRQQIRRAATEIVDDVRGGHRGGALEKYLDEHFVCRYEGRRVGRDEVIALIESQKKRYDIHTIEISGADIDMDSAEYATMRATTQMAGREPNMGMGFSVRVTFVLKWIKRDDGWKIHECEEPIMQRAL